MDGAFDAHAHLDQLEVSERRATIARAAAVGVTGFAISAGDPAHWDRVEAVAREIGAFAQLGLHPWWAQELDAEAQDVWLERLAGRLTPFGLGETGLDRVRADTPSRWALQLRAFRRQLTLARDRHVPVVLHGVRAWGEVLDALPKGIEGVLHGFTGSPELASRAVRQGLHVSFGRTLRASPRTRAAAAVVPSDRLMLESDGPDGGEPADLPGLAAIVAKARGEDAAERLALSSANARRLFRAS